MSPPPRKRKKTRRWRQTPYFKIQVFNETFQCWKDERKVFETADAAREHIASEISPRAARVVHVERESRHVLDPEER